MSQNVCHTWAQHKLPQTATYSQPRAIRLLGVQVAVVALSLCGRMGWLHGWEGEMPRNFRHHVQTLHNEAARRSQLRGGGQCFRCGSRFTPYVQYAVLGLVLGCLLMCLQVPDRGTVGTKSKHRPSTSLVTGMIIISIIQMRHCSISLILKH